MHRRPLKNGWNKKRPGRTLAWRKNESVIPKSFDKHHRFGERLIRSYQFVEISTCWQAGCIKLDFLLASGYGAL